MKSFYSFLFIQCAILLLTTNISLGNPLGDEFEDENIDNRSIEKRSAQCGKFELYNSCSPSCEKICDDLNNDNHKGEHCDATKNDCVEKCVCKKGFVRENLNGKCIRIQECPRVKH